MLASTPNNKSENRRRKGVRDLSPTTCPTGEARQASPSLHEHQKRLSTTASSTKKGKNATNNKALAAWAQVVIFIMPDSTTAHYASDPRGVEYLKSITNKLLFSLMESD